MTFLQMIAPPGLHRFHFSGSWVTRAGGPAVRQVHANRSPNVGHHVAHEAACRGLVLRLDVHPQPGRNADTGRPGRAVWASANSS